MSNETDRAYQHLVSFLNADRVSEHFSNFLTAALYTSKLCRVLANCRSIKSVTVKHTEKSMFYFKKQVEGKVVCRRPEGS
jgi:hypothetical protein